MIISVLSLLIAIIALCISIWGRVESYRTWTRQLLNEKTKRVGEALVASQILKNTLSDNIDLLKEYISTGGIHKVAFKNKLSELEREYEEIWQFVKDFEQIIILFEKGGNMPLKPSAVEAKIHHFNQRRELALYDIKYINELIAKPNS